MRRVRSRCDLRTDSYRLPPSPIFAEHDLVNQVLSDLCVRSRSGEIDHGLGGSNFYRTVNHLCWIEARHADVRDQRMNRPVVELPVTEKFLTQLLAPAQPRIDDLGRSTRDIHQLASNVSDPHRRTHVEDQRLPWPSYGTRIDDELHGFGDGHEEAGNLRMRYRDRPTGRELLGESCQNRSATAQNIAEADREERASGLCRRVCDEALTNPL